MSRGEALCHTGDEGESGEAEEGGDRAKKEL